MRFTVTISILLVAAAACIPDSGSSFSSSDVGRTLIYYDPEMIEELEEERNFKNNGYGTLLPQLEPEYLRVRKDPGGNFQLRVRRNPENNFQLRVRKNKKTSAGTTDNFQLRVRKDLPSDRNFQLRIRKSPQDNFQLRMRRMNDKAADNNFQLRVRKWWPTVYDEQLDNELSKKSTPERNFQLRV